MIQQILRRFLSLFLSAVLIVTLLPVISVPALAAVSGELSGLTNKDVGASYSGSDDGSYTSWSVIGGNGITGTAKSKDGGACGSDTKHNTTLTLTNNKDTAAILSFDYKVTRSGGTIQVAGSSVTEDGSYSATIDAGSSIKIYLESGDTNNETKIEIANLSMIVDTSVTTTFQPAENGSYTVDGESITEERVKTQQSTVAYSLSATADDGYKFYGWYSVTQEKYLSMDAETSLRLDSDQMVTAVFVSEETPIFDAGGSRFTDLNEANKYASDNGIGKITLVSDGTLPAGSYTVSKGVTLLIPFDDAGTMYTTTPATTGNTYTAPSAYRTLTMAPEAHITVDGAISVSAMHTARGNGLSGNEGGGAPSGKYGYIFMAPGSSITVSDGGALYVWGFISGSGTVTAESGAVVYENIQIVDFRGGSVSLAMSRDKRRVFPFNQFFIQNIETELVMESGAEEYIYSSLYAANMSTSTSVKFIGVDDGMFRLENGSKLTKRYDPETDRLEIELERNASVNPLAVKVSIASFNSESFVLSIPNNMTLRILSGTTKIVKEQDLAFLPGVEIDVAEEATLEIGKTVYIYDRDEWMQQNFASNAKFKATKYSPTRTYNRTNEDLKDVTMDVNGTVQVTGHLYTTGDGADIISSEGTGEIVFVNGAGTETETYQVYGSGPTWVKIPITSAKLHNGVNDPEYTETAGAQPGDIYQFCEYCQKWYKVGGHTVVTFIVDGAEPVTACAENGTVTCPVAAKPIKVTVRTPEGDALDGAEDSWADGTLTITGLYLNDKMPDEVTVTVVTQAVAQIVQSDGTTIDDYATLADAVANFNGETQGYIQLLGDVTESVTIDKAIRLDLAGYDVNGEVTITGDGTLYGMDSSSDGYAAPTGSITTVTGGTPVSVVETTGFKSSDEYAFFRYLAIAADDRSWSFHRFNISVTGYRFELAASSAPECALFFIAQFSGDELVRKQLEKIEITMTEDGKPITGPSIDFTDGAENDERLNRTDDGFQFEAYLVRAFSGENAGRYEVPIIASSKAIFANGGTQKSEPRRITYLEAWEKVDVAEITLDQKEKLDEFLAGLLNGDGTE